MAKNHIMIDLNPDVEGLVERVIADNPQWFDKFNTGNDLEDFNFNDIVTCTYSKGLYQVKGNLYGKLCVVRVGQLEEIVFIHPCFLKKVNINNKLLKVLYGS
jgi:hypothetical protein